MSFSPRLTRLALRTKLLTLAVCSTGSMSLSATATGFHRASGSFITDGFVPGMWFTRTGFSVNTPGVITAVTATDLAVTLYAIAFTNGVQSVTSPAVAVETAASGRTITVGLPRQAWENVAFTPIAGVPYVREDFVPGPSEKVTYGPTGIVEWLPLFEPQIHVASGTGSDASDLYTGALLALFAPGTPITVSGASVVVRGKPAPYSGQLLQSEPGFAVTPVTVPLRLRTRNPI